MFDNEQRPRLSVTPKISSSEHVPSGVQYRATDSGIQGNFRKLKRYEISAKELNEIDEL